MSRHRAATGPRWATGELQGIAPVAAARAEHAWLEGERERVPAEASRGLAMAMEAGHAWYAGELAYWLWRAGALAEARRWRPSPTGCS